MSGDPSGTPEASGTAASVRRVRRLRVTVAVVITGLLLLLAMKLNASDDKGSPRRVADPPAASPHVTPTRSDPTPARTHHADPPAYPWLSPPRGKGHLIEGSHPGVLPAPVLIADKLNNRLVIVDPQGRVRWKFPRPGDLRPGQTFKIPDDAFFTPDGRNIVATQEDDYVITLINIAHHRIVWRYGKPGVSGSRHNRLYNPDDAILLADGTVVAGDIKNCRLIAFTAGHHHLTWSAGSPGNCFHQPPDFYGSPNGMFPAGHGKFLVTEINGDWVDMVDRAGHVFWATHPPGVAYPSDSNKIGPNRYLTVDYSDPGQIVVFNRSGHTIWRFDPTGADAMRKPSLALPMPNGDIIANDDANHRVIVVDPRTNRIVWQYGHTGMPGSRPGYLYNPDGLDLLPPYSLVDLLAKNGH